MREKSSLAPLLKTYKHLHKNLKKKCKGIWEPDPVLFAELSAMIYFSPENFEKYFTFSKVDVHTFSLETVMVTIRFGHSVIVVFKGSSTVTDWIYNLKFWKVPSVCGGYMVHNGINQKHREAFQYLKETLLPEDKIYLAGHSLGGALSLLTAYSLKTKLKAQVEGVYVYGCPRVGGLQWQTKYNQHLFNQTFSYQNQGDMIPSLPPKALGYRHVGQHIQLENKKKLWSTHHLPWFYALNLR